ncbi:hypothetical protein [Microbacterium sp. PM5]|uniref:hypothetical protein n=1 Tax=Microbacterium sp. PM5 TaxID=2014534 RepID=UPI0013AFA4DB|nr:hypothetical protein [Microbacterium sp. PM5]
MPTDDEGKFQTGATNLDEVWTFEGEEAALQVLLVGKRRDPAIQGARAEALGRTLNGVNWKIDAMDSNLDEFRTASEKPLRLNAKEAKLLADYQRDQSETLSGTIAHTNAPWRARAPRQSPQCAGEPNRKRAPATVASPSSGPTARVCVHECCGSALQSLASRYGVAVSHRLPRHAVRLRDVLSGTAM